MAIADHAAFYGYAPNNKYPVGSVFYGHSGDTDQPEQRYS